MGKYFRICQKCGEGRKAEYCFDCGTKTIMVLKSVICWRCGKKVFKAANYFDGSFMGTDRVPVSRFCKKCGAEVPIRDYYKNTRGKK